MTLGTRAAFPISLPARVLICLLPLATSLVGACGLEARAAEAAIGTRGQLPNASPPVTAWADSVHAAFARPAHEAVVAAHRAFTESGLASWYGRAFAGKRTSSGTRFNPMQLTCAHRTLPLGTRLLVTSQDTGRSVIVTVNDRGPYAGPDRIIDLSTAAATRLGMVHDGLNTVTLKRVAPPAADVEVAQAPNGDGSNQVGAASAGGSSSSGDR